MDITQKLTDTNDAACKAALVKLLERYLNPAFGSLPKREIDILFFEVLEDLKVIREQPNIYNLLSDLKVTRSKARSLLYDRELRKLKETDLDQRVKEALKNPIISKAGDNFKLEIESPLVSDHLKATVQKLKHLSDGSFSPSIVTLSLNAVSALFAYYLSKEQQKSIKETLVQAGVPDSSFKGVLKSVFKKLASKVASDAGEALIEDAEEVLSPILSDTVDSIKDTISEWFKKEETK